MWPFLRVALVAATTTGSVASVSTVCAEERPSGADRHDQRRQWDSDWDKRQDEYSEAIAELEGTDAGKASVGVTRHILLVRHGQYVSGDSDQKRILTPLGRQQAELIGGRLKALGVPFHCLWSSTMARARETADIIEAELGDRVCNRHRSDLFREGCPVLPYPNPVASYAPSPSSVFQDSARIEAGYRHVFHRQVQKERSAIARESDGHLERYDSDGRLERYDLVVCHGNVIRYWLLRVLQLEESAWLRFALYNCSLTWITIFPTGRVSVRAVGDTGHIPEDILTYS